jgi:hypothetical protein
VLQIGVHNRHEWRGAGHHALDHSSGQAPTLETPQAGHPAIGERQRLGRRSRPVGRIVVDDDELPADASQRLIQLAGQRGEIGGLVERRRDDGEFERRQGATGRFRRERNEFGLQSSSFAPNYRGSRPSTSLEQNG